MWLKKNRQVLKYTIIYIYIIQTNKQIRAWSCWNCTGSYKFSVSVKKMGEGWTGGASDIVKAESSEKVPRATGGIISDLFHPQINENKATHHIYLFSFKYKATTLLICVHAVSVLPKIWWRRVHNFPDSGTRVHIFYFYFCFVVGRPLFPTTKPFMGCPLPLSLTLTPLSVGTWGTRLSWVLTLRGIRRGGSRDAIRWLRMRLVWGLRTSRDESQPVNL